MSLDTIKKITYILFALKLLTLNVLGNAMTQFNLSEYESNELKNSNFFMKTEKLDGFSWPKLTIFNIVEASPLETVAIFAAYDHQKNYIPNLIKSQVIEQKSSREVIVSYELDLPWPLSNSRYVHGHKLTAEQEAYQVDWYMISSTSANKVEGTAQFRNWGTNKTLFIYESKVDPKSILSGLVKKNMIKDVKRSLKAVKNQTEWAKEKNKKLLDVYVQKIKTALSGTNAY